MSENVEQSTQESEAYRAHLREIKDVLYGKVVIGADKRLVVAHGMLGNPWGFEDGAPEAFLFGVMHRDFVYEAPKQEHVRAYYTAGKCLGKIGKALNLATAPDHAACLMRHLIFRPVVLELDERTGEDGRQETVLHAYSSRSLFSLLSILRAAAEFEKQLPKQMHRSEKAARKEEKNGKALYQSKSRKS